MKTETLEGILNALDYLLTLDMKDVEDKYMSIPRWYNYHEKKKILCIISMSRHDDVDMFPDLCDELVNIYDMDDVDDVQNIISHINAVVSDTSDAEISCLDVFE